MCRAITHSNNPLFQQSDGKSQIAISQIAIAKNKKNKKSRTQNYWNLLSMLYKSVVAILCYFPLPPISKLHDKTK
jgi:glycopeptide antibiotics resistance protein